MSTLLSFFTILYSFMLIDKHCELRLILETFSSIGNIFFLKFIFELVLRKFVVIIVIAVIVFITINQYGRSAERAVTGFDCNLYNFIILCATVYFFI